MDYLPAVKALGAPTYYILSRRENYVWGQDFTYGGEWVEGGRRNDV